MNAIAKSTTNNLSSLSQTVLAEMANNAARNVEEHAKAAVTNAITAGQALLAAKAQCKHGQWLKWLKENWEFHQTLAARYMELANKERALNLTSVGSIAEALRLIADARAETKASNTTPELFADDSDDDEAEGDEADVVAADSQFECTTCGCSFDSPVWHCDECGAHWGEQMRACPTCQTVAHDGEDEDSVVEYGDNELAVVVKETTGYITLRQWEADPIDVQRAVSDSDAGKPMNKQDTTSIEWAQWSWNPVTGCKHDCPYCYARDIANRFYNQKFEPSIYPGRLSSPRNTSVPKNPATEYKNVFTCSMADLFGRWVPDEWIEAVLTVVDDNPQWNFLFLTKFPQRISEFGKLPKNAWMGTTVDCQERVANAEKAFAKLTGGIKWLSCEPMLTPLKFTSLKSFDWVVIGGASASSQTPAWTPPFDWVNDLHNQAREAECKIFHKTNLGMSDSIRLREFPWVDSEEKALPEQLKYLSMK